MYRRRDKKTGKPVGPYYYRDPATNRKVSSETTDKKTAERKYADLVRDQEDKERGKYVQYWEEAAPRWMKLHQHLANYRSQTEYHAFWMKHLIGMKLNVIDEQLVHQIIMQERPISLKARVSGNSTANNYVGFVKKIIRYGRVLPPKFHRYAEPRDSRDWLRPEEWSKVRELMDGDLRWIVTFALSTGLRISNVIGFEWGWLHGNSAFLPAQVTKTDQDYGIPLNKTALGVIAEVRSSAVRHSRYIFVHNGQQWEYPTLLKALKTACRRARITVVTPHGLRHTFASWLAQEGVSDAIRRRLGCWQLGKGADSRYLHFDVERLRRFAEVLDPLLEGCHVADTVDFKSSNERRS